MREDVHPCFFLKMQNPEVCWLVMKSLFSDKNVPRIAAVLAGVGLLGGVFSPAHAEAGYRKVPERY